MKKIIIVCSALFGVSLLSHAQVGIGTKTPSEDAMLDIVSTANDKGVILPKVKLKALNTFLSTAGQSEEKNIGMVVYNTTIDPVGDLDAGFYFWTGRGWERFVDQSYLKEIINNIMPNPDGDGSVNPDKKYVVYQELEQNFYTIEIDGKTATGEPNVKTSRIPMDEIVQFHESKTLLSRRVDDSKAIKGNYELSDVDPDTAEGKIVYRYGAENGKNFYFDLTEDIYSSIVNNEKIINELHDIINNVTKGSGGNVFYGIPPTADPSQNNEPSLYEMIPTTDGHSYNLIDISNELVNILQKNEGDIVNKIRNLLGYDIDNRPINTGNKFQGKQIYVFTQKVSFNANDAQADPVILPKEISSIWGKPFRTSLLSNDGAILPYTITDIVVNNDRLDFALGQGAFFTPVPEGFYQVVIEFVEK